MNGWRNEGVATMRREQKCMARCKRHTAKGPPSLYPADVASLLELVRSEGEGGLKAREMSS